VTPRALLLVALLLAVACNDEPAVRSNGGSSPQPTVSATSPQEVATGKYARIACDLPEVQLRRILNGFILGKSGEIQFVLRTPHFFGANSHSGPWNYLQRVPLFFYGPGHVAPAGEIDRPVTVADIAPTFGRLLGYDFQTADGRVLEEAMVPDQDPPRLVVLVVWDGGGRNVMAEYPGAWDEVQRLIPEGAWFDNATVGSSPSVTPATHATMGTGVFPRTHGALDLRIRDGDRLVGPILNGPQYLLAPSLADEYDRDRGNEPVVGFVATEPALGMVGHGSSDNAAVYGSYLLQAHAGRLATLGSPSIATSYGSKIDLSDVLAVAISQSGKTEEIVETMRWAADCGARTVGVTNGADSPLAAEADVALVTRAGNELAVPATKTYNTQLAALAVLALGLGADLDALAAKLGGVAEHAGRALVIAGVAGPVEHGGAIGPGGGGQLLV
jgi:hypothetical protein